RRGLLQRASGPGPSEYKGCRPEESKPDTGKCPSEGLDSRRQIRRRSIGVFCSTLPSTGRPPWLTQQPGTESGNRKAHLHCTRCGARPHVGKLFRTAEIQRLSSRLHPIV